MVVPAEGDAFDDARAVAGAGVGDGGADDGAVVDPVVLVEGGVLGGDDGVAGHLGDLVQRHRDARLLVVELGDLAAVGGEDEGVLRQRLGLGQGRDAEHVAVDGLDHAGERHRRGDEQRAGERAGPADHEGQQHDLGEERPEGVLGVVGAHGSSGVTGAGVEVTGAGRTREVRDADRAGWCGVSGTCGGMRAETTSARGERTGGPDLRPGSPRQRHPGAAGFPAGVRYARMPPT